MSHLRELFSCSHTAIASTDYQSRAFCREPVIPIISVHSILRSDHVFGIKGEFPPSGHRTEGVFEVRLETRADALLQRFASGKDAGPGPDEANIRADFKTN